MDSPQNRAIRLASAHGRKSQQSHDKTAAGRRRERRAPNAVHVQKRAVSLMIFQFGRHRADC